MSRIDLNRRERAALRAVAAGGAEITWSCEPDLFVDGACCCDQPMAHGLAHRGFVRPTRPAQPGQRVPAEITAAGQAALIGTPGHATPARVVPLPPRQPTEGDR